MAVTLAAPGERIIRKNVPWEEYERLLSEHDPGRGIRIAYDEGTLEIMVLSLPHEEPNRTLATLIEIIAVELRLNFRAIGSTTIKRKDLFKGVEPDSCYYIRSYEAVKQKRSIDFGTHPPDLAVEVDVSHESLDKFPIFASIGIAEVWRFSKGQLKIYRLRRGEYQELSASEELPAVTSAKLTEFLETSSSMDKIDWIEHVRAWVRANR